MTQRLLVSVRGPREAIAAANGGAAIADVEYPASALGTPYPLNIATVRRRLSASGSRRVLVSTNIGELQVVRATACQAALGVAFAGADLIKFGLAEMDLDAAANLARSLVRTVRELGPPGRKLYPAVFIDDDLRHDFDPFADGPELVRRCRSSGILLDTFNKTIGKGLLDYCTVRDVTRFVAAIHKQRREAWIAGSIGLEELPELWKTGVDVICVRGAACVPGTAPGRFGTVTAAQVRRLAQTLPRGSWVRVKH